MSRFSTVYVLVLLLTALPTRAAEPAGDGPRVRLDPPAIDFGTVARQSCHERRVQFSNLGRYPIRLLDGDSDCPCLSLSVAPAVLGPGERTTFRVTLNTCDDLGEARRQVWLKTDHPDCRRLKLPMRYRVVPELFTEPEFVGLGLPGHQPIEIEVSVRTLSEKPIHLMAATCDDPSVIVDLLDEQVTRTRPARVRILVQGYHPEGRFRLSVLVETTSSEVPRLRIPLFGESVTGLRCDRREVVFDAVPSGTEQTRNVTFRRAADVQVGGVRTSNETVDVQAVRRDGQSLIVTLRSNPKLPLGRFRGFLLLEVNNGQPRKIKLPYRGRVIQTVATEPAPDRQTGKADPKSAAD